MSKLCLGTVQFGMKYGINNQNGQPSEEACFDMLDIALEKGINVLDTARAYGTAEIVIGNYLEYRHCHHKVEIISKFRPNIIDKDETDVYSVVRRELEDSLKRLHVSCLKGYLFHTPEYVYNRKNVEALFRLKDEGLVQNIGVSIYNMEEGFEAIRRNMDYVQLPYSILDQRGMQSDFIRQAKKAGMTVFTRSAFLQGLFMMDLDKIPGYLNHAKPYLSYFRDLIDQHKRGSIELLLQFIKGTVDADYLVFGVDNEKQLLEDIRAFREDKLIEESVLNQIKKYYCQVDESIIFPSLWSNGKKAE